MRSVSQGSPCQVSPVGSREENTVPAPAPVPIFASMRCQPGGVLKELFSPPMPLRAVETGHAATAAPFSIKRRGLPLDVDEEETLGKRVRHAGPLTGSLEKRDRTGSYGGSRQRHAAHSATRQCCGVTLLLRGDELGYRRDENSGPPWG